MSLALEFLGTSAIINLAPQTVGFYTERVVALEAWEGDDQGGWEPQHRARQNEQVSLRLCGAGKQAGQG